MFATQFDFHGKCNIQTCHFFIVNVYANINVFTPLRDYRPAMVRGGGAGLSALMIP